MTAILMVYEAVYKHKALFTEIFNVSRVSFEYIVFPHVTIIIL